MVPMWHPQLSVTKFSREKNLALQTSRKPTLHKV